MSLATNGSRRATGEARGLGGALVYTRANVLAGLVIFTGGDTLAAGIAGELSWTRALGVALLGSTLYAVEIPSWFAWIDRAAPDRRWPGPALLRTALAQLLFNPFWIARHLFFLKLFAGEHAAIGWDLFRVGAESFVYSLPFALAANHLIQNRAGPRRRFAWSSLFSAAMAVYYAVSEVLLR